MEKDERRIAGGKRAAQKIRERYGETFYQDIGAKGGKVGGKKGFALMDPVKRAEAGRKGGQKSRRGKPNDFS